MNKTIVMISGERQKVRQKAVRWPCGVCSKGVGSNSLQCKSCQKWVHKNTHTHPFNGPFFGTTHVSQYQKGKTNLDFTEERDSEWQWHQLGGMQVCTSLQTDNHASTLLLFFTGRMPFLPPNQQRQSTEGKCTWVHKKFSGIKGSMSKVAKSFICSGCLNVVTSAGRTSVDIGASAKLELVDKFCYLGDMLSVDGDADAAVEARFELVGISSGSWYHCLPIRKCVCVCVCVCVLSLPSRPAPSPIGIT